MVDIFLIHEHVGYIIHVHAYNAPAYNSKKIHGMGHLLEIIHDLPQAKTRSLMLYFLYVVASLKTPPEFFLSFHVDLPILDWFTATLVHFCYL